MAQRITRKDIRKLSEAELNQLVLAFYRLQSMDPDHEDSYFQIAGYHGEPFRGAGYSNPSWWGGYCNHGNILFPTWHRAYLYRLERALQKQVPGVALPYWDEIDKYATEGGGIPEVLLAPSWTFNDGTTVVIDGKETSTIPNPLHHYTFQKKITDRLRPFPDADYSKPAGVETVRFPFSGLYGAEDIATTEAHNDKYEALGIDKTNEMLVKNVQTWLNEATYQPAPARLGQHDPPAPLPAGVKDRYLRCLEAPNYVVFSNTTSAERWNDDLPPHSEVVVPVESPHNMIHLAVGGIQIPSQNASTVQGANGDMGENDTSSFDPIFYFHHCFIDRMFWAWQVYHNQTDDLKIDPEFAQYPGTNSVDSQGPTPGVPGNQWLSLDSPLSPFVRSDGQTPVTSRDVINIANLGYEYDSIPELPLRHAPPKPQALLTVSGANRATISGSFYVAAWLPDPHKPGLEYPIGIEAVLSRWHVAGCANCNNHLEVTAHFPLPQGWTNDEVERRGVRLRVHTRERPKGLESVSGRKLKFEVKNV
ncbi:hypothetical protein VTJ83DRAFT_5304 [Remersonia thermophila]|uniref:tyrosinase n=1 Tax=Remersonia thermophila TaxID=72144 RepID=A0ABR4D8N5_9PEZI